MIEDCGVSGGGNRDEDPEPAIVIPFKSYLRHSKALHII